MEGLARRSPRLGAPVTRRLSRALATANAGDDAGGGDALSSIRAADVGLVGAIADRATAPLLPPPGVRAIDGSPTDDLPSTMPAAISRIATTAAAGAHRFQFPARRRGVRPSTSRAARRTMPAVTRRWSSV